MYYVEKTDEAKYVLK